MVTVVFLDDYVEGTSLFSRALVRRVEVAAVAQAGEVELRMVMSWL